MDTPMGRLGDRPLWVRNASVIIRALHQIGAALFLAAFCFNGIRLPVSVIILAAASGLILTVMEWMRHPQMYRETFGVALIIKLLLTGMALHSILIPPSSAIVIAFLLSSIASHLPRKYRHRLLF